MSRVGETCWTRSFGGRNPSRVLLANEGVVFSYVDDQGPAGAPGRERLVCLDARGNERWSTRDFQLHAVLGDRLVGVTQAGGLRIVDLDGDTCDGIREGWRRVARKDVAEVRARCDGLVVRTKRELVTIDSSLAVVERFSAPTSHRWAVVGDAVIYVDGKKVMRRDRRGTREFCSVPDEIADEAMTRWEDETGTAALRGVSVARCGPGEDQGWKEMRLGDRVPLRAWVPRYDEAGDSLFLVNSIQPHVVVRIQADGHVDWCTYLGPDCCGGAPTKLPNGELAVSSGCGGFVSWLDQAGRVLRRSAPLGMMGSQIRALADSSCLVGGGSAVMYAADGTLRWRWGCSCFDYDDGNGMLVAADWSDNGYKTVSLTCVKSLGWGASQA